eukprot:7827279-Heterocapsa_arctica.AAC.1
MHKGRTTAGMFRAVLSKDIPSGYSGVCEPRILARRKSRQHDRGLLKSPPTQGSRGTVGRPE